MWNVEYGTWKALGLGADAVGATPSMFDFAMAEALVARV